MSDTFVTLARQRDGLMAVWSLATQDEKGLRCALTQGRIEEAKTALRAPVARAMGAWRSLARTRLDDPRDLASALMVLLETVPLDTDGPAQGFPTPPLRRPVDLRAILCGVGFWEPLRQALRGSGARVLPLLRAAGYDRRALDSLLEARDPYVAVHHGVPGDPGLATLPRVFRASILPLLRSRSWSEVLRGLSWYRSLDLEHDDVLLALVVRLLALAPRHGYAWWGLVVQEAPERRGMFLRALLASGASATDPSRLSAGIRDSWAAHEEARYQDRLSHAFAALCAGVSSDHVLEGFRIADAFAPRHRFRPRLASWPHRVVPRHRSAPADLEALLRPVLAHVTEALGDGAGDFALGLWERAAECPGLAAVLGLASLRAWPAPTAVRILRILMYDYFSQVPVEERARAAEGLLATVPASHHGKALDGLEAVFERWPRGEDLRPRLPAACALLARLARPPFKTWVDCEHAVPQLVEAAGLRRISRLTSVSDRSLARLDGALASGNAHLLHGGLEAMSRKTGELLVDALAAHPESLFAAARLLGSVSEPRRLAILARFRSHPVAQRRFKRRTVEEMARTIAALAGRGLPSPVPRKLREHLLGTAPLTPGSLERHRQAIVRRLLPLKLGLLRRMVLDDLGRGLPRGRSETPEERHALQMLGSVVSNRRVLRRVLSVAPDARGDFLRRHPANLAWLRRHRGVDAGLWTGGIERVLDVPGCGRIRLALEGDPLHVLRMEAWWGAASRSAAPATIPPSPSWWTSTSRWSSPAGRTVRSWPGSSWPSPRTTAWSSFPCIPSA